jgi:hypothetical protein
MPLPLKAAKIISAKAAWLESKNVLAKLTSGNELLVFL